jgi:OFA family oxalate/formate antiporter-like MFS transporter
MTNHPLIPQSNDQLYEGGFLMDHAEFAKKRYISLTACMIAGLFTGIIYTWSVFVIPLATKYHWSTASISLAYTLNIIFSAVIPIVFAKLRAKIKISNYNLIGAIWFAAGMLGCSIMKSSVWELYLYFGVLVGGGIGFMYVSLVSYVVQAFPDRGGLAAGLYTGAYALASLVWAPVATNITTASGDVADAFRALGIAMFIVQAVCSRFYYDVPKGWKGDPALVQETGSTAAPAVKPAIMEISTGQLFTTPLFYVTLGMFVCGLLGGSMILSLGSPILQGSLGYTPAKAAYIVGFFAVAQVFGRIFWGGLSDKLGRMNVITIVGLIAALSAFVLANIKNEALFIAAIICIPMAYAAYASMLSPTTREAFGAKHFTTNYNILFTAFAIASLIGPQIVAFVKKASGGYQGAFIWAIGFALGAVALSYVYRAMEKSARDKSTSLAA